MSGITDEAELYGIYYHRLRILVLTNGLEWITDLRDREYWQKEMWDKRESMIMHELPEEFIMDRLDQRMDEMGMGEYDKRKFFIKIRSGE